MASLGDVPFFSTLDESLRETLEERLVAREYSPGEVVFHEGDPGLGLFVVFEGELAILGPSDRLLARLGPGEVVGEMALLDGGPRSATARATKATRCGLLTRGDVLPLLRSEPALALELVGLVARRVRSGRAIGEAADGAEQKEADASWLDRPLLGALAVAMLGESVLTLGRRSLEAYLASVRAGGEQEDAVRDALEVAILEGVRAPARIAETLLDERWNEPCDDPSE